MENFIFCVVTVLRIVFGIHYNISLFYLRDWKLVDITVFLFFFF